MYNWIDVISKQHFLGFSKGQQKFSDNFEKRSWSTFFFKTVVFVVVVFRKWHFRSCWSCFATSGLWFTSWFWSKLMVFMAKWTFQIHKSAEVGQNFRISNKKMHLNKWQQTTDFWKKKLTNFSFSKIKSVQLNWRYFKTALFGVFEGSTKVFR